jgi:hypothetical protein
LTIGAQRAKTDATGRLMHFPMNRKRAKNKRHNKRQGKDNSTHDQKV